MRILVVITSFADPMPNGKTTGVWLEEIAAPYYAFLAAGATVVLASPKGGKPPIDAGSLSADFLTEDAKRFLEDAEAVKAFSETVPLADVSATGFDALFYPGGHGPLFDLVKDSASIALIEAFASSDRPVGAVCHGPAVFSNARGGDGKPIVAGKKVTGFSNKEEAVVGLTDVVPFSLEDDAVAKGGLYEANETVFTPHVVSDFPLVTGQNPGSSRATAESLLQLIKK